MKKIKDGFRVNKDGNDLSKMLVVSTEQTIKRMTKISSLVETSTTTRQLDSIKKSYYGGTKLVKKQQEQCRYEKNELKFKLVH